ncbi:MAG: hypothetical protein V1728_00115 [Candidatus Micrarchaeota archaeon]
MWLTHSKNASKSTRQLAASLASHLPSCRLLTRSKRPLERIETLAQRAGVGVVLVLVKNSVLRARRQFHDSAGREKWAWDQKELVLDSIEFGPKAALAISSDTPFIIKARSAQSKSIAAFLGMEDDAIASLYDEPQAVSVSTSKGAATLKAGKSMLVKFKYSWGSAW